MTWRARLVQIEPWDLSVRLHVFNVHADGRVDVLLPDGILQTLEEAAAPPPDAGLKIPQDAMEAIAEVFHPYATGQARLEGEIKRLEEALKLERARVELLIDKALEDR